MEDRSAFTIQELKERAEKAEEERDRLKGTVEEAYKTLLGISLEDGPDLSAYVDGHVDSLATLIEKLQKQVVKDFSSIEADLQPDQEAVCPYCDGSGKFHPGGLPTLVTCSCQQKRDVQDKGYRKQMTEWFDREYKKQEQERDQETDCNWTRTKDDAGVYWTTTCDTHYPDIHSFDPSRAKYCPKCGKRIVRTKKHSNTEEQ